MDCTSEQIKCQTSSTFETHRINNDGVDPIHGKGYAWSDERLVIDIGDSVVWSWSSPIGISDLSYRVVEVEDADSEIENGFSSGLISTSSGIFTKQFQTPGTYHYWSDYIDTSKSINFRGEYYS